MFNTDFPNAETQTLGGDWNQKDRPTGVKNIFLLQYTLILNFRHLSIMFMLIKHSGIFCQVFQHCWTELKCNRLKTNRTKHSSNKCQFHADWKENTVFLPCDPSACVKVQSLQSYQWNIKPFTIHFFLCVTKQVCGSVGNIRSWLFICVEIL